MTVLVAIPYFGCPGLVERAVRSILAQTVRDLALVVIGDGEEPPLGAVRDARLEVLTLPENRGPYFALSVALAASPHEWFSPHGADDWSDPEHLERLLATGGDAVATGAVWWHADDRVTVHRKDVGYEVGIFKTDRLRALGGYNPAERLSQDSLLLTLLRMTGPVGLTNEPTYHRVIREGSLTQSPATKRGSPARKAAWRRIHPIVARCWRLRTPRRIRAYREGLVPAEVRTEVEVHAERLRERLGRPVVAA